MSGDPISVIVEDATWKKSGVRLSRLKATALLALEAGLAEQPSARPKPNGHALTLLLADDERLRSLNAAFRAKESATNVLSFPASHNADGYLGDVAIAFGMTQAEAASAGITLEAHAHHLVAHGVLHLLGYDHVRAREAKIMERLEIAILGRLGIADPYAHAALAG